jgi:hypothetical protein
MGSVASSSSIHSNSVEGAFSEVRYELGLLSTCGETL